MKYNFEKEVADTLEIVSDTIEKMVWIVKNLAERVDKLEKLGQVNE
jgi:hypothetical protein